MNDTATATPPVRIGLIGAGANTRLRHIPGFQQIPGVTITAVANQTRESAQKVATEYNIPHVADNWRDLIQHPEVDAVCIGTWPYMHAACTIEALKAGKHVLTEARMAANLDEARKMHEASRNAPHLVAQIVPSPFTLDLDATVRQWITDGHPGELVSFEIQHCHGNLLDPRLPLTWRQDPRLSGVNMLTLGIYHEIILRWFPGISIKQLMAHGRILYPERIHFQTDLPAWVGLPDALTVQGRTTAGALFQYHFSTIHTGPACNHIILHGTRASLRCDIAAATLSTATPSQNNWQPLPTIPGTQRGWQVEADFISSIRSGHPVRLTHFDDGVRYMAFTQAAHHSWKESRQISL